MSSSSVCIAASAADRERLLRRASVLAVVTILYNIFEGLVSVGFGASGETLSLFGFGVDSFVEVVSGVGVWHMVRRLRSEGDGERDRFERTALLITGRSFYVLAAGLAAGAVATAVSGKGPVTTFWGLIVSVASIVSMLALVRAKERVGREIGSEAILADAACTRVCLRLSVVLLAASAGFQITGVPLFDVAGSLGIAWYALQEGREAMGKAAGKNCRCSGGCG